MTDYRRDIERFAASYALDPDLVEAIVIVESFGGRADAFRFERRFYLRYLKHNPEYAGQIPRRVSSSYGLMQVMYPTARDYGFRGQPEMLFVPDINLDIGCKVLSALLLWAKGNVERAVRAYNGGKGNADKAITEPYWRKVDTALKVLRS